MVLRLGTLFYTHLWRRAQTPSAKVLIYSSHVKLHVRRLLPGEEPVARPLHSCRRADSPISCSQSPYQFMGVCLAVDAITSQKVCSHYHYQGQIYEKRFSSHMTDLLAWFVKVRELAMRQQIAFKGLKKKKVVWNSSNCKLVFWHHSFTMHSQ